MGQDGCAEPHGPDVFQGLYEADSDVIKPLV
jgi:hypothetical protein